MTPRRQSPEDEKGAVFESLYDAHHRAVLAFCARRLSPPDAWDAASEVFVVALRRLDDLPPQDQARAWLLGVAYRVVANQHRAARRRRRLIERVAGVGEHEPPGPEEPLIRREEESEVIAALSRLRPTDREILQLSLWEELPAAEIAGVLGISRAAVDQRYARAKRRLAVELNHSSAIGNPVRPITSEKGGAP